MPAKVKLNRRLVVVTGLTLSALGAGIFFLHHKQVAASVGLSREAGLEAVEAEDWHQAVSQLRYYLEHHPGDAEALKACAEALDKGYGEVEEAYSMLDKALSIDPYLHEARLKLVSLALKLQRTDEAAAHAKTLLERFPTDVEVIDLAARVAEADRKHGEAVRLYARIIQLQKNHLRANQRLTVLAKALLGNDRAAALSVSRLKDSGDTSFETLTTFAEFHFSEGQIDEAGKHLLEAIAQVPQQTSHVIVAAQLAVRICGAREGHPLNRALESALSPHLRNEIGKQPDSVLFDMTLAQLQSYADRSNQSLETSRNAIDRVPNNLELRFQLSWQLIEGRHFKAAAEQIQNLKEAPESDRTTALKYAELLESVEVLQREDFKTAANRLEKLIGEGIKPASIAPVVARLEASCHEQLHDWNSAVRSWQRVVRLEPQNRRARLSLGLSLIAAARQPEGIRILTSIRRLGDLIVAVAEDIPSSSKINRLKPHCIFNSIILNTRSVPASAHRTCRALVHAAREEYEQAFAAVDTDEVTERLFDIVALTASSKVVSSDVLETVVKLDPDDARALTALILARKAGQDKEQISRFIRDRLTGVVTSEWVRRAQVIASGVAGAGLSLQKTDSKRSKELERIASSLLERMVNLDPTTIPQLVEFHLSWHRMRQAIDWCKRAWPKIPHKVAPLWLSAASQHRDARTRLGELEELLESTLKNPNNATRELAELRMVLSDLYLMTGRFGEAESSYRLVLKTLPDQTNALNNVAWLLSTRKEELDLAGELIEQAIAQEGLRPDLLDTRGCVRLAQGENEKAVQDFQTSVERGAGADTVFHLAVALRRTGNNDGSKRALDVAFQRGFDFSNVSPLEKQFITELKN